jgi:hypothetical protein
MFHLTYILYVLIIYDSSFSVGKKGPRWAMQTVFTFKITSFSVIIFIFVIKGIILYRLSCAQTICLIL